jgi:hypothetical protein
MKNLRLIVCTGCVVLLTLSCTHKGKVEADEKSTVAAGENAEDLDAENVGDDMQNAEMGDEDLNLENKAMGENQDLAEGIEPDSATTPPAAATAPQPPVATMNESGERVVRYVLADNTPAFEQADEKSKQVGSYNAGDPVVVKLSGDWAEVSDSYFIKSSALSTKLVPRKRSSAWKSSAQK